MKRTMVNNKTALDSATSLHLVNVLAIHSVSNKIIIQIYQFAFRIAT